MNKFEKVTYDEFLHAIAPKPEDEIWVRQAWEQLKLPERATAKSAGYDFHLPMPASIPPYGQRTLPTGVKCQLDDDCVLLIDIRSSMGIKRGLSLANTIAVIDADYYGNADNEGHIFLCVANNSDEWVYLDGGDRVAQGVIVRYEIVADDSAVGIRKGGIGSTDVSE